MTNPNSLPSEAYITLRDKSAKAIRLLAVATTVTADVFVTEAISWRTAIARCAADRPDPITFVETPGATPLRLFPWRHTGVLTLLEANGDLAYLRNIPTETTKPVEATDSKLVVVVPGDTMQAMHDQLAWAEETPKQFVDLAIDHYRRRYLAAMTEQHMQILDGACQAIDIEA